MPHTAAQMAKMRSEAFAKKAAARAARQGLTAQGASTLVILSALADTDGRVANATSVVMHLQGLARTAAHWRLGQLARAGFIERAPHAQTVRVLRRMTLDAAFIKGKRLTATKRALAAIDAGLSLGALAPAPERKGATVVKLPSPANERALRAALKALMPFARYGARLSDKDRDDATPLLMSRDGLRNSDFKAAHAAREALLAALASANESAADQDEDMTRYYA